MEDNESTPEIALKQKKVSFSDAESVITEDESTPEIGLNQKKVSFFDVKSIIVEDNESTPEISWNQKKVSFADVDSVVVEGIESTQQTGLNQNVEVPHDLQSNNHEYKEPLISNDDSLMETFPEGKGSVNVDPSFKISPKVSGSSPSCSLAPLDADPLILPYDPKTNYISPRPQFLHYRPNPRIELYREREGKQLEEHFASESYSDTDVTEETQSEGSLREWEDISSEQTKKEGEEEEEEELHVSEPNPIAPDMVEESFEAKRMSKPRFSTRSKFIAVLMVLAFASFSVLAANSPAFTSSGLEELSLLNFHVPPEVTEFAKANLDRFTENLQHWSASFLSYVSNIVSSSQEVDELGLFEYANLSNLLEDHMIEGQHHLMFDHSVTITEPVKGRDAGAELVDNKYYGESEADEAVDEEQEDQKNEAFKNLELVSEEETDAVQQEIGAEMIELDQVEAESEGVEFAAQIDPEHQSNVDINDKPSIIPQATEIRHDISKTGEPEFDDLNNIAETMFPEEEVKSDYLKIEDSTYISQSSEVIDSTINGPEDQFLTKNMMGFALLVLCLLAASALIYTKRGKTSMPNASVPVKQPLLRKESEYSPVSGSNDKINERLSSRNWQTEVDMVNESCPSDMSSCHRTSSSYSKKGLKEPNKYQSQERKTRKTQRRESLASSDYSMGSPSYGSFTTYDKIPSKHGGGDEGTATPVRRSSRIRNQVIST